MVERSDASQLTVDGAEYLLLALVFKQALSVAGCPLLLNIDVTDYDVYDQTRTANFSNMHQ